MKKSEIRHWAAVFLAAYMGFCAYLFFFQRHLIFFPTEISEERREYVASELGADIVTIRADDRELLEGWFLSDKSEQARPTIIFFGGNAQRLDLFAYTVAPLTEQGINVLLVDYRGYGYSTGKPDTEKMQKDAEKLFDAASSHPHVDKSSITAWGISLGSGIAAHLAAVKPVAKVILFSPFTSTEDVARDLYPFVPVSLLLTQKLDTLALAPALHQPALIVTGDMDKTISPEHAETVAKVWKGPSELLIIPDRHHNDLLDEPGVWEKVVEFAQ